MATKIDPYSYMTDDEAVSFIKLMVEELLVIAERRGFRTVLPGLASAELNALAISGSKQLRRRSGTR